MFENIIGQEKVKQILTMQIKGKKIPHSYIFMGQDGVGKRFCAIEFAKLLNCLTNDWSGENPGACNTCSSCHKISKNLHPDIHFIDFEKQAAIEEKDYEDEDEIDEASKQRRTLGIKVIREYMLPEVSRKANEGKWKVFIVEPADKLTSEAANCLLKTLEEPPDNTIIILIARHKETIPQTIVSRCQTLFFKPLKESEIADYLVSNMSLPVNEAERIAQLSEGSIEYAQKLIDADNNKVLQVWEKIKNKELKNMAAFDVLALSKGITKDNALEFIDAIMAEAKKDFRIYPYKTAPILELFNNSRALVLKNMNTQTIFDCLFLDLSEI
ncbi:MAG: DNA polymerase III subunit [Elusimicrobiota bacterium]|jgi:DNA polymerase-3 subunit delta'|nr:DNA polymerase III subunit [Elusimicrobiota bacterium]